MTKIKESIIHPFFLLKLKEPQDKYYQEFQLFVRRKSVIRLIEVLRKKVAIGALQKKLKNFKNILLRETKARTEAKLYIHKKGISMKENPIECIIADKKFGCSKLQKQSQDNWRDLEQYVDSRISSEDIRKILKIFNKPFSWVDSLSWYILTREIITPSARYNIKKQKDRIILAISSEATARDHREAFKGIKKLQPYLQGYEIKGRRIKKELDEHLNIAKDRKKYVKIKRVSRREKDYATGEYIAVNNKEDAGLALVDKYNPKAFGKRAQKKEEARQRQIYHRYKKYV